MSGPRMNQICVKSGLASVPTMANCQPQCLLLPSRFQENDRQGIQSGRVGRCGPQYPSEECLGLSGLAFLRFT